MKPRVVVTRNIPAESLELLTPHFDVDYRERSTPIPRRELLRRVKNARGLLCLLTERVNGELLDAAPELRIVSTFSVGLDHVDVPECTRRGVLVTHTPGVLTETCADFTWALILSVARRIVEGDRMMRAGKYKGWDPLMLLGADVHNKTLGILGFGRIGQAVARRAGGFDMRVLYSDVRQAPGAVERDLHATFVDTETLLKESDFVCLHTVLDQTTYHLLDERRLRMMKKTAYLINGARGPIIDEGALVKALKGGWIRGAALDVYENEPKMAAGLAALPNAVLIPHLASATLETRGSMGRLAAGSIADYLAFGRAPSNAVNPQVARSASAA
ncbi:MAG: D-glycerate dehydrogenase [Elusimicrobia bacterium]|nr:D-glycerate dehydrogenase [Elusimicrobiota bacterium]